MAKRVKINLTELADVMEEDGFWNNRHYLDMETGQIITILADIAAELEKIYAGRDEAVVEADFDLTEFLPADRPEWPRQALLEAGRVKSGYGTRSISPFR